MVRGAEASFFPPWNATDEETLGPDSALPDYDEHTPCKVRHPSDAESFGTPTLHGSLGWSHYTPQAGH